VGTNCCVLCVPQANLANFINNDITNSPVDTAEKRREREERMQKKNDKADAGEDDKDDAEEMEMMHFANAGKDASDILSWRLYIWLCSLTKMIMLLSCLYISFYWLHYRLRVEASVMESLDEANVELTQWSTQIDAADKCHGIAACFYTAYLTHFLALFPIGMLVFSVLPRVTRRISILVGVLHLHDAALEGNKTVFLQPFVCKNDDFTKTGSGQT
jgi:hypothetical protein